MNTGLNEELVQKMTSYEGKIYGQDFLYEDLRKDFSMFDRIVIAEKGHLFAGLAADRLIIRVDEKNKVIMVMPR